MTEGTNFATGYAVGRDSGNAGNANGMWGNDWAWIIILLLFGWGKNGWGGNGNGTNGGVVDGYVLASDFSNVERKIDSVNNGMCDGFYAINSTLLNGFAGVNQNMNTGFQTAELSRANQQAAIMQQLNNMQAQNAQCCCDTRAAIKDVGTQSVMNTGAIQQQIERCCCETEKMNLQNRFDNQSYNCNTLQAIEKVGDRIIDYMANDKAQTLRDENQALRLAASQSAQNQYIINALRPMPIPSYPSCNPWAASYGFNNCNTGCGCNNF